MKLKMHSTIVTYLLVVFLIFEVNCAIRVKRIIGGVPADLPPSSGNIENSTISTTTGQPPPQTTTSTNSLVFIKKQKRSAIVNGVQNADGTYSFLGIRYAQPPLNKYRFQRPRRLKLRGEVDATKFGPPCAQLKHAKFVGNEDCLFLNIFVPKLPNNTNSELNPVLVWIHGGNFMSGSAAQYVPTHLVKKGIVVVTIQYRLGSLGFLSIKRKELPGNVGLFDIGMAMRWIYDYIKFFGGNPKRITVGGQGSGASCATMLALNKHTKGLVKGVLAMSGSPVSPFSFDTNETATAQQVSNEIESCDNQQGINFVRCMQKLPIDTILKAESGVQNNRIKSNEFPKNLANLLLPGPTVEGKEDERFLPNFILQSPLEAFKNNLFAGVPLMTGVTEQETATACQGNFFKEIQEKLLSPAFLQSNLFTSALYANNGLFVNNTVNSDLSALFLNGDYLKFFSALVTSALSDFEKVIKHTTDAFFNLPAFITSNFWSKKSNVYLYSFEHKSKQSTGDMFLSGIPLVSLFDHGNNAANTRKASKAAHGDELIHLFELRSLDGEQIDNNIEISEDDIKVQQYFSSVVAEFIRSGKPNTQGIEWKPFTTEKSNYMIINETPKLNENFHKCEIGLWTGDQSILNSLDCSVLSGAKEIMSKTIGSAGSNLLSKVDKLSGDTFGGGGAALTNPLNNNGDGLGLFGGNDGSSGGTGLLFGGVKNPSEAATVAGTTTTTRTTTMANSRSGLLDGLTGGGFLG